MNTTADHFRRLRSWILKQVQDDGKGRAREGRRKLDFCGRPRHEAAFAIGPAPLVKRWPHSGLARVVRLQG